MSLAVLVPAALAASLSIDAVDYLASRPSAATLVARGATGELRGAGFRVLDSWTAAAGSAAGDAYGVPDGAALVSVTVELDPTAASGDFMCRVQLLEADRHRRWSPSFGGTDYVPGAGLPDDVPGGCALHDRAYPFEEVFLVPLDAQGRVVLEVIDPAGLPRVLHLEL